MTKKQYFMIVIYGCRQAGVDPARGQTDGNALQHTSIYNPNTESSLCIFINDRWNDPYYVRYSTVMTNRYGLLSGADYYLNTRERNDEEGEGNDEEGEGSDGEYYL